MNQRRRGLDDRLLDALGDLKGQPFEGTMWRVVRNGRSALDGSRGSGRWNTTSMSVLYGAKEADGAVAEIHFHISRGQPVFPSKMRHNLFELSIRSEEMLVFNDFEEIERLGVDRGRYSELLYDRTQEIAAAAAFLGYDGLIVPSARWDCLNIVLFLDNFGLDEIQEISVSPIDWKSWQAKRP